MPVPVQGEPEFIGAGVAHVAAEILVAESLAVALDVDAGIAQIARRANQVQHVAANSDFSPRENHGMVPRPRLFENLSELLCSFFFLPALVVRLHAEQTVVVAQISYFDIDPIHASHPLVINIKTCPRKSQKPISGRQW